MSFNDYLNGFDTADTGIVSSTENLGVAALDTEEIMSADNRHLATRVRTIVDQFLVDINAIDADVLTSDDSSSVAVSRLDTFNEQSIVSISKDKWREFAHNTGIPDDVNVDGLCRQLAFLTNLATKNFGDGAHEFNAMSKASNLRDISDLYQGISLDRLQTGREAFGRDMDGTSFDLRSQITIAVMRFHVGLGHRIMPARSTNEPAANYTKETVMVFDISDKNGTETPLSELYVNPSLVSNVLDDIVPLKTNDTEGVLVEDNVIKFGVEANLLELAVVDGDERLGSVGYTDVVADNVKLHDVYIELKDGTNTETFVVRVPISEASLGRQNGTPTVHERTRQVIFHTLLSATSKMSNGSASTILGGLEAKDRIRVDFRVTPSIDLRDSRTVTMGVATISLHTTDGTAPVAGTTTKFGLITDNGGAELTGYSLKAPRAEENMRNSTITVRNEYTEYSHMIPTGKNYILDYSLQGKAGADNIATYLSKIIGIGQDDVILNLIEDTLDSVADQLTTMLNDKDLQAIGRPFAAGGVIRPYVISDTFNLANVKSIKDADRTGDIQGRIKVFMNWISSMIESESHLSHQLPSGAKPTFRIVTSGAVLSNVLGQPHIHNHLDNKDKRGSGNVEYKFVLDDGTVFEVVTTTYKRMAKKMFVLPYLQSAPNSVLNAGHLWKMGDMVGHYTHGSTPAFKRVYANSRELPVITCPIGAIIDIEGLDSAPLTS